MTAPTTLPKWADHMVLDEEIRDAIAHTSDGTDIHDFNKVTVLAKNTLDQSVSIQWQGDVTPDFANVRNIGAPIVLAAGNITPQYDVTAVTVYYPYYRVVATAGGVPTVGYTQVTFSKGKLV